MISEEAAKMMAAAIKQMIKSEKEHPKEKSTLEQLDERIKALNRAVAECDENPLLKRQILLQLRTAMKKRNELVNGEEFS